MGSKNRFRDQQDFEADLRKIIQEKWFPENQFGQYNVNFEESIEAVLSNNVTNSSGKLTAVPDADRRQWSTFSAWDRIVKWDTEQDKHPLLEALYNTDSLPPHYQAIPPEIDKPAPHKITSRFAMVTGDEEPASQRRIKLIESLESDLLATEGENQGMNTYFTLGAITGAYYRDYDFTANQFPEGSSFAYKKCFYTIQYQAWWDNDGTENPEVQPYVNRAMDWLEVCRNYEIPATCGAFISFKDDSIPTHVYFQDSYDMLKEIKEAYSKDPDNILSSRKTII